MARTTGELGDQGHLICNEITSLNNECAALFPIVFTINWNGRVVFRSGGGERLLSSDLHSAVLGNLCKSCSGAGI